MSRYKICFTDEMMDEKTESKSINIVDILNLCLRFWWLFVILVVLGAFGGFAITMATTTKNYKSEALLYVNNSSSLSGITQAFESLNISDINAAKSIVDAYCIIIKARVCMDEVCDRMNNMPTYYPEVTYRPSDFGHADFGKKDGFVYDYDYLSSRVSVGAKMNGNSNTEIFYISVTSENKYECVFIANVVADVARENIGSIINGTSVKIVDNAQVPTEISQGFARNMLIGLAIGFVIAAGIIVILYFTNDVVESSSWFTSTFGDEMPVLAIIPDSEGPRRSGYRRRYRYYSKGYYSKGSYGRYGSYYGYGHYGQYGQYGQYGKVATENGAKSDTAKDVNDVSATQDNVSQTDERKDV